jgi:hypothetical protein
MHLINCNSFQSSLSNFRSCLQVHKSFNACSYTEIKNLFASIYKLVWSYAHIIFLAGFASQGILGKDCKVRLDETDHSQKNVYYGIEKYASDE